MPSMGMFEMWCKCNVTSIQWQNGKWMSDILGMCAGTHIIFCSTLYTSRCGDRVVWEHILPALDISHTENLSDFPLHYQYLQTQNLCLLFLTLLHWLLEISLLFQNWLHNCKMHGTHIKTFLSTTSTTIPFVYVCSS